MKKQLANILGIVNALLYLIVIGLWISVPEEFVLNVATTVVCLSFTGVLLFVYRENFAYFYHSNQFKNFVSTFFTTLLVFIILGFVNYLGYKNPILWDFSSKSVNSLTGQTKSLLNSIEGEVEIKIFSLKKDYNLTKMLVDLYRFEKNDIKITFVDAELFPAAIQEAGVLKVPSLEIKYKGRKKLIDKLTERDISNALVQITRKDDPIIYFTVGHGEMNLRSQENEGGYFLYNLLQKSNLDVRTINFQTNHELPAKGSLLVYWGPKSGLFPGELKKIQEFVSQGGHLLLALDPDFNGKGHEEFISFLEEENLTFANNLIIDQISHVQGSKGTVPVVHKFNKTHPISEKFTGQVFFPLASSLSSKNSNSRWQFLAESNIFPASWGESDRKELSTLKLTFTDGIDQKGPLYYVAAREDQVTKGKILVFGNSTFVMNSYKKFPQNFMFLMAGINWLMDEERLISFNLPTIQDRPIFISGNQKGVIFYSTVIFFPLILFLLAFFFYRRRSYL